MSSPWENIVSVSPHTHEYTSEKEIDPWDVVCIDCKKAVQVPFLCSNCGRYTCADCYFKHKRKHRVVHVQ